MRPIRNGIGEAATAADSRNVSRQSTSEVAEDRADPEPAGDPELNRGAEEAYTLDPARGLGEDGTCHHRDADAEPRDRAPDNEAREPRRDGEDHVADRAEDGREDHRAHDRDALGHQWRQHGARHRESEQQRAGQQTDRWQGDIEIAAQVADHRADVADAPGGAQRDKKDSEALAAPAASVGRLVWFGFDAQRASRRDHPRTRA